MIGYGSFGQVVAATRRKDNLPVKNIFSRIWKGNHMISSAIWNKFFKGDQNCTIPQGECNLLSLRKFARAHLFQIAREKSRDH